MSLKDIVARQANDRLIVTQDYIRWLALHGDDPYPGWVADQIHEFLTTKPRDRSRSFSASSAGTCLRAQEIEFLGLPVSDISKEVTPELNAIFRDGKWRHLKWQADLLTAEIIREAEFTLTWRRMNSRGTMDGLGVVRDDHPVKGWRDKEFGFELKGVNAFQWSRLIAMEMPSDRHLWQVHRYFVLSGMELFVVIYENKSTQQWHEWVITPIPELMKESRVELKKLNLAVQARSLHPMLAGCRAGKGTVYKTCSYGGRDGTCWGAQWSA